MSKKPITWLGLIKAKLHGNKGASINDIMPETKKEWAEIKAGTHSEYSQGSSSGQKRSGSSKAKRGKRGTGTAGTGTAGTGTGKAGTAGNNQSLANVIAHCRLCKACKKKIAKVMQGQKGGDPADIASTPVGVDNNMNEVTLQGGGGCGCGGNPLFSGGGKRKTCKKCGQKAGRKSKTLKKKNKRGGNTTHYTGAASNINAGSDYETVETKANLAAESKE